MNTKVTFNEDGTVSEIKLRVNTDVVGYAKLEDSHAYITTVYPMPGHDGVSADMMGEMAEHLEKLPFVESVGLGYEQ